MSLSFDAKDPDEVLDYTLDWSARLPDSDTIATSTWIISGSGLTEDTDSKTDTTTTIWLSGGTLNTQYDLTNRVVTVGGRTMDQTVKLKIRAK